MGAPSTTFFFNIGVLKKIGHNWARPLEKKITSATNKTKPIFRSSSYFERTKKTQSKKRNKGAGSSN